MDEEYEVFISFKNLDEQGNQTPDSLLAQEVYQALSSRGLNVFFSNVSLEKLGISAYKRAIDDALDASKVLVAVGTSGSNLDSQWVRYEWDSFFNDILSGVKPKGRLFVYLAHADISDLPRTLRQNQCIPHGEEGMERLCNFVANALGSPEGAVAQPDTQRRPSQTARDSDIQDLKVRFGRTVKDVLHEYPFVLGALGLFNQQKIYRGTGKSGPSGDKEAECRICGAKEEFDRYFDELPESCSLCGFDGIYETRLFFGFSRRDADLAHVLVRGLELEEFHIRRSGYALTNSGKYNERQLLHGLSDRGLYVCLWTKAALDDSLVSTELSLARQARLPILFLTVDESLAPVSDSRERVLDFSGPDFAKKSRPWTVYLVHTVCDMIAASERDRMGRAPQS